MKNVSSVNPFRCRMWAWHDRLDQYISEETCRVEIESFARHGQRVPALGRPLHNDPDHDVELVYGARRLFVAQYLNVPLLVEVQDIPDKDAFVAMDIENRQRLDVSAYERGLSYTRWLRAGCFQSQDDLATSLRISPSRVSRFLKLARLPAAVVNAFSSPVEICEGWAGDLADCMEDPAKRPCVLEKARAIAANERRPAAREIYRQLISAAVPGRKIRSRHRDEVVKDAAGRPMFRIRIQTNTIAVLLPAQRVSAPMLTDITEAVARVLRHRDAHDAGVKRDVARVSHGSAARA